MEKLKEFTDLEKFSTQDDFRKIKYEVIKHHPFVTNHHLGQSIYTFWKIHPDIKGLEMHQAYKFIIDNICLFIAYLYGVHWKMHTGFIKLRDEFDKR